MFISGQLGLLYANPEGASKQQADTKKANSCKFDLSKKKINKWFKLL